MKYRVSIQFADPNAPDFDDDSMTTIHRAVAYYNEKSRMARNPKQISKTTVADKRTLELVLESEGELPYPGKALRVFSLYLIDPGIDGAFRSFVYGKNLFKTTSEVLPENEDEISSEKNPEEINALRIKAISLLVNASEETLKKVIKLIEEV